MTPVDELSRKLHELDVRLRAGTISRADVRKIRRKAILTLEDPHLTIPGSVDTSQDDTIEHEHTTPTRPLPSDPPALKVSAAPDAPRDKRIMLIFAGVGALVALVAAALLMTRSGDPDPAAPARAGITDAAPAGSGPDLPQTVSDQLMKSGWTDADIAAFLSRWNGISPEARRAARDDQGMWLLRGETDRRLHEAVDAAALDPTPEAQSRIDRLSALQAALRPE